MSLTAMLIVVTCLIKVSELFISFSGMCLYYFSRCCKEFLSKYLNIFLLPVDISLLFCYSTDVLRKKAQKIQNLHRGTRLRKEHKMKKTIVTLLAALLVSSIALFATPAGSASPSFDVTTEVLGLNFLTITSGAITATNMQEWNSQNATLVTEPITIGKTAADIAHVNLINNKRNGVAVFFNADKMGSIDNSATNTFQINYVVSVNGASYDTSTDTGNVEFLSTTETAASSGLFIGSYPINVDMDDDNYDDAPEDNYQGTITFTFTAS